MLLIKDGFSKSDECGKDNVLTLSQTENSRVSHRFLEEQYFACSLSLSFEFVQSYDVYQSVIKPPTACWLF